METPHSLPSASKPKIISGFLLAGFFLAALVFFYDASQPIPIQILETAGTSQILPARSDQWRTVKAGDLLMAKDTLRTGPNAFVRLKLPSLAYVVVQKGTEVSGVGDSFMKSGSVVELKLHRGGLIVAAGHFPLADEGSSRGTRLVIQTSKAKVEASNALFKVAADPEKSWEWYGTLHGKIKVHLKDSPGHESFDVRSLSKVENISLEDQKESGSMPSHQWQDMFAEEHKLKLEKLTTREWVELSKAYDSLPRIQDFHREQNTISREAGNLFQYVFDHGGFYTPDRGYLDRCFFKSLGQVALRIYYDVYTGGSFVGMYMKTQNLYTQVFSHLNFEIRRLEREAAPESIFIEVKSNMKILKSFELRDLRKSWQKVHLPIETQDSVPIDEIVILFKPDRAGPAKQGVVEFRNFNLRS